MLKGEMLSTVTAEERFRQLYDRHAGPILMYFKRRTDSETAQDCTAETFLVAWRRIDDVPDEALPWLYGWLVGCCRTSVAAGAGSRGWCRAFEGWSRLVRESKEAVIRRFEDAELAEALRRMRREDRELLLLANWEELPHADIGRVLGCSAHAVDQRIYRALHRLARDLADAGQKHGGMTTPTAQPEGETP